MANYEDISISRRGLLRGAAALGGVAGGLTLPGMSLAQSGDVFKLGWVRPTTGRLASSFAPLYAGGMIAIDEINAAGGIMGKQIVRDEQDDEASPAKEPSIVLKYQGAGVHFICGPTGSSQALSSIASTTARKMIQTTYALAAEMGNGTKFPYHYQLIFNSDQQAEACVAYLCDTLKLKKIGILQESTAYGEQITPVSKAELKKRGLDPVDVQVFPITAPDLSGYVQALRKAGADGILMWMSNIPNAAMIFNSMNSMKWYPPIAGHTSLFLESLLDLVPAEAIKNVYGTWYKSLTWSDTESPAPRQVEYAKKILKMPDAKGSEVNAAGSPYYDFLYLLKKAIEEEKSLDVEKVKANLDRTTNYDGILGKLTFTPEKHCGIGVSDMVMATIGSARDPKAMGIFRARAPG